MADQVHCIIRFSLPFFLAASGCADSSTTVGTEAITLEGTLDDSSPMWRDAPFLHEIPFECPLPVGIDGLAPVFHEYHGLVNGTGDSRAFEVSLEPVGSDAPILLVYKGCEPPSRSEDVSDCLGLLSPTTTPPIEPDGEFVVVLMAYTSADFGDYRVQVTPTP
jgi:hypothetical protein